MRTWTSVILLDSQVALWLLARPDRLGARAVDRLRRSTPHVSAISFAEFAIKSMLGRLRLPDDFADQLQRQGVYHLPFTHRHAEAIPRFESLVRHDPFDRMILAQAAAEGGELLTADGRLLALGLDWVIPAAD